MRQLNAFYCFILLALCTLSNAQVVRRTANFTHGEGTLSLRDSVRIFATDFNGGYYQGTVHAWVHEEFVNELDKRVMGDAPLLSAKKDSLGTIHSSYPVDSLWESKAHRMSKYYEVILSGQVLGRELERKSFPTNFLENYFSGHRLGAVNDALKAAFKKNGWEYKRFNEYECWAYLNRSANPSEPDFQALFIVRSGLPYCLVNKGESFEYAKLKESAKRENGTFYFFQRPNDRFMKEIDDIVFDYLPL